MYSVDGMGQTHHCSTEVDDLDRSINGDDDVLRLTVEAEMGKKI